MQSPADSPKRDNNQIGIDKFPPNSRVPIKEPKGGPLSPDPKAENRELAQEWLGIEHIHRRFKMFKILAECYRNRRRRYGLRCNLIAALHNYELAQAAA